MTAPTCTTVIRSDCTVNIATRAYVLSVFKTSLQELMRQQAAHAKLGRGSNAPIGSVVLTVNGTLLVDNALTLKEDNKLVWDDIVHYECSSSDDHGAGVLSITNSTDDAAAEESVDAAQEDSTTAATAVGEGGTGSETEADSSDVDMDAPASSSATVATTVTTADAAAGTAAGAAAAASASASAAAATAATTDEARYKCYHNHFQKCWSIAMCCLFTIIALRCRATQSHVMAMQA
eukprot:8034-Heterococcus_DN1.PRE.1